MKLEDELRNEVRDLIRETASQGIPATQCSIAAAFVDRHDRVYGADADVAKTCMREFGERVARKTLGKLKADQTRIARDSQMVLDGYQILPKYSVVERNGTETLIHTRSASPEELDALQDQANARRDFNGLLAQEYAQLRLQLYGPRPIEPDEDRDDNHADVLLQ